jgi:hypothetical protein
MTVLDAYTGNYTAHRFITTKDLFLKAFIFKILNERDYLKSLSNGVSKNKLMMLSGLCSFCGSNHQRQMTLYKRWRFMKLRQSRSSLQLFFHIEFKEPPPKRFVCKSIFQKSRSGNRKV